MKEPKKKIDALTENDAQRLLNYMKSDKTKDELTKTRDYAMVAVLLYT
jgi:site-specific recombinase XerD